jgi:hypothetical protein
MPSNTPTPRAGIRSIKVTDIIPSHFSNGDTWNLAWSREGDLYTPVNDGAGFHDFDTGWPTGARHVLMSKIPPDFCGFPYIYGKNTSMMDEFSVFAQKQSTTGEALPPNLARGPDGCTWKASGCKMIDGVLYLVIARHRYGQDCHNDPLKRQTAENASIIKSTDEGKTWTRTAQEIYDTPMFPGQRFATPFFIDYGQDGREHIVHGNGKYVYAHANGGYWDNSDDMVLGRVLRADIGKLDPADWQYFTGGDGMDDAAWSGDMARAKPVLERPGKLGSTGATYLPQWDCYVLIGWHYPDGGGKLPGMVKHSVWEFHVAPTPWGPWRTVGESRAFQPEGFYCPSICSRFTAANGKVAWVATSGNWENWRYYRLNMVRLVIE